MTSVNPANLYVSHATEVLSLVSYVTKSSLDRTTPPTTVPVYNTSTKFQGIFTATNVLSFVKIVGEPPPTVHHAFPTQTGLTKPKTSVPV